mgnify:CR=1 FL=1
MRRALALSTCAAALLAGVAIAQETGPDAFFRMGFGTDRASVGPVDPPPVGGVTDGPLGVTYPRTEVLAGAGVDVSPTLVSKPQGSNIERYEQADGDFPEGLDVDPETGKIIGTAPDNIRGLVRLMVLVRTDTYQSTVTSADIVISDEDPSDDYTISVTPPSLNFQSGWDNPVQFTASTSPAQDDVEDGATWSVVNNFSGALEIGADGNVATIDTNPEYTSDGSGSFQLVRTVDGLETRSPPVDLTITPAPAFEYSGSGEGWRVNYGTIEILSGATVDIPATPLYGATSAVGLDSAPAWAGSIGWPADPPGSLRFDEDGSISGTADEWAFQTPVLSVARSDNNAYGLSFLRFSVVDEFTPEDRDGDGIPDDEDEYPDDPNNGEDPGNGGGDSYLVVEYYPPEYECGWSDAAMLGEDGPFADVPSAIQAISAYKDPVAFDEPGSIRACIYEENPDLEGRNLVVEFGGDEDPANGGDDSLAKAPFYVGTQFQAAPGMAYLCTARRAADDEDIFDGGAESGPHSTIASAWIGATAMAKVLTQDDPGGPVADADSISNWLMCVYHQRTPGGELSLVTGWGGLGPDRDFVEDVMDVDPAFLGAWPPV